MNEGFPLKKTMSVSECLEALAEYKKRRWEKEAKNKNEA
jgi:hypothetical protein